MQSLFSQGNLQLLLQRGERPARKEFTTVWPHPAHPCRALAPPGLQSKSSSTRSLHSGVYTADGPRTGQTGRPAAWTVEPQGILGKLSGFRFSVTSFSQREHPETELEFCLLSAPGDVALPVSDDASENLELKAQVSHSCSRAPRSCHCCLERTKTTKRHKCLSLTSFFICKIIYSTLVALYIFPSLRWFYVRSGQFYDWFCHKLIKK